MSLERRFSVNGTGQEGKSAPLAERHRKADQALAERYERLGAKLAETEKYLRALHLPRPIHASYNERSLDYGEQEWDTVSFVRYKGEWRLCHAHCCSYDADENTEPAWKPVAECSTDVRLEAIAQLGKLKIEAAKAKEEYVNKVDSALEQIDKFLSD
jgi:hypothetical protein